MSTIPFVKGRREEMMMKWIALYEPSIHKYYHRLTQCENHLLGSGEGESQEQSDRDVLAS